MQRTAVKSVIKVLRVIYFIALIMVLLFFLAVTLNWPEAWIFLTLYFVAVLSFFLWMRFKDPGLYKERSSVKKDTKSFDRVILAVYSALLVGMFVLIGFDAVRFRWSRIPLWLEIMGFAGFIPVCYIVVAAASHNTFLSQTVRIQYERGHMVCTTGPYRIVRHPMYAAVILFVFFIPLALGSYFGLIGSVLVAALFILRTALEDRTLQAELEGYRQYSEKVRYRLIPGIW